jgi:hypothetical protein
MPMFNSSILPDVTGRVLGSADKQWDGFFRNIQLSGTLSGTGLTTSDVANPTPDVDSVNVQSDPGTGMLTRFRITNPSAGPVLFAFKHGIVTLGGTNAADSPSVPLQMFCNVAEVASSPLLTVFQRGSNVNPALIIDMMGRINSYANAYTNYAYAVLKVGDVNPIYMQGADGAILWGAGGNNALDVGFTRTAAGQLALTGVGGVLGVLALGQLSSNIATGTPPLVVASTTRVANLNADKLDDADWTAPPTIGSTTPGDVHAALLTASAQIQSSLNDGVTPPFSVLSAVPVNTMRVKFASDLTIEGHLLADGSGAKHKRVNIASLAAGAEVIVIVTWTTPFADSVYTPVVSIFDAGTAGGVQAGLRVKRITQQDATKIGVQVINDDTVAHAGGVLLAHAFRG